MVSRTKPFRETWDNCILSGFTKKSNSNSWDVTTLTNFYITSYNVSLSCYHHYLCFILMLQSSISWILICFGSRLVKEKRKNRPCSGLHTVCIAGISQVVVVTLFHLEEMQLLYVLVRCCWYTTQHWWWGAERAKSPFSFHTVHTSATRAPSTGELFHFKPICIRNTLLHLCPHYTTLEMINWCNSFLNKLLRCPPSSPPPLLLFDDRALTPVYGAYGSIRLPAWDELWWTTWRANN